MKQLITRIVALVGGVALVATTLAFTNPAESKDTRNDNVKFAVDKKPLARDSRMNASFAPVVKRVSPSVVKVSVSSKGVEAPNPFFGTPFDRFFGEQFGPGQNRTPKMPVRGLGSGVIVSEDGYILTNNHVVDEADEVKVSLQDGREYKAKVVGKDPKTDVAVLKIDAKNLPKMDLADSDQIEVGDIVLALGNPFGIGQSVTMGIVSAKGRATLGLDYEDFIQTDAPINPGNSGGALVDTEGRLIGINTAIYSRTGGNQGIGFAIPTNLARGVMESLVKYGKVTRGYIGVSIQDITPDLAKAFNLKETKGAIVSDVVPQSPAAKAKLKSGDVIIALNGKPVQDSRQLKLEVARVKPGTSMSLKLLRDGETKTVNLTLKEFPEQKALASNGRNESDDTGTLQGVGVANLTPEFRQQFNVPKNITGAIVTHVEMNSAAASAGLKPGDVILEVNRKSVSSAEDAIDLTQNAKEKKTLLRVWSERGQHYLIVDETEMS